jgi:hypothetical protein
MTEPRVARSPFALVSSAPLLSFLLVASPAAAQSLIRVPSPNGAVYAFASIGSVAYVGGAFDQIGRFTGGGVALDATTAATRAGNAGFRVGGASTFYPGGIVMTSVADGSGGWFVGGDFLTLGGVSRPYLAHVDANGALLPWTPAAPNAGVRSLLLSGGTLYVGGDFTALGGSARSHLAAVDATTGALLGWNPGADDLVVALALSGSTLYVGGSFMSLGGQARPCLGAVDAVSGVTSSWNPNVGPIGSLVYTIALAPGVAYVGGYFGSVQGVARTHAAGVDLTTGAATTWTPNPNAAVRCLLVSGASIFAGGEFSSIGGRSRTGLALLNNTNGNASVSWNAACDDHVYQLAASGSTLLVAGAFASLGGQPRKKVGAIDAATALATPWAPVVDERVWSISVSGTGVYLGGTFQRVEVVRRRGLAAIDLVTRTVTSWDPDVVGTVHALLTDGSTLWVGGTFSQAGGLTRNGLAAYALPSATPTTFDAQVNQGSAQIPDILALALDGGVLRVGGYIDHLGGQVRNSAGAVDPVTGAATAWDPAPNTLVRAIVPSAGGVYLAGAFSTAGGAPRNLLAQVDRATGAATSWVPPAFAGGFTSHGTLVPANLFSLAEKSGILYVGGSFQSVAGQLRANYAALASSGALVPWDVTEVYTANANWGTMALNTEGASVLAASTSPLSGGFRVLDPSSGASAPWPPSLPGAQAVDYASGYVLVGGNFLDAGTAPSPNLAVLVDPATLGVPDMGITSPISLAPPFPNPARLSSSIAWRLARPAVVSVSLVDLAGRKVRSIADRAPLAAGPHARTLDLAGLSPGLYLLDAEADGVRTSHKLLIVR